MAFLEASHELFGRLKVYAASAVADLPTTSASGAFNPGDIVINYLPTANQPWAWTCLTGGVSPTWTSVAPLAGGTKRSVASPATLTVADSTVFVTTAGTVTLPAAALYPSGPDLVVINTAATPVTLTPVSGTINGAASATLAAAGHLTIVSDGTNYYSAG